MGSKPPRLNFVVFFLTSPFGIYKYMVEFREKNSATSKGLLVREVEKNTIQRFRYFCYEMMEITKITNSEND